MQLIYAREACEVSSVVSSVYCGKNLPVASACVLCVVLFLSDPEPS